MFWLAMQDVFSRVAEDVAGQILDYGTKIKVMLVQNHPKGDVEFWFGLFLEGVIARGPKNISGD